MVSKKVVFGSSMCPDCIVMKKALDEREVKYLYLDITENLANLKKFLKFREDPAFDFVKENGSIGIPAMVVNDGEKIIFSIEEFDEYFK
ncbi:glutaredoxin domain-containing protein [Parvimonas sp. G1604]|uniref:glutaredoxin domain-containing protein n=1 Tax=Parvimonas sp. G1604 TaxID=3388845 RepID=UPI0039808ED9